MPPPLRIFVSSPGDVREERLRAQLIIAKLARDYAGLVDVQPYFWESEPLRASGHFQDEIELPSQHDIVVLILWSRLGTPLPVRTSVREYVGMDGRTPVTGTEWEFEDALAAFQLRNTPDLLVYRRSGDPGTSLTDAALRAEQERQWQALQEFWARHFENRGEFLAASARYDSLEAFDERLEADLAKLIERRLAAGFNGAPAAHLKGPPYRGLSTYDFADAPVFFGRDGAIRSGLLRLSKAAETGCGCLVVLGASGSGKSSLARAGLVPALVAAKAVPGVGLWRRVVVRPGDAGADPIAALAGALLSGNAARGEGLAELGGPGTGAAELTRHLRASTDDASYPFRTALGALAEHERSIKALLTHEEARLVLLVDQLEELFTRPDITENDRLAFVRLLAGLARSGVVWVIATMRSDLWHRAAAIPELLRLTEDGARLDLLPPDAAELLEVIRRPARATGLGFEEEARIGLDAVLAEAAAAEPGALPLLSVVLEDLYRHDVVDNSGRSLTFAGYRAMGELKGAIATRAELAWTGLDARDSQAAAALPEVLRTLVTSSTGEAVTSRPSHLDAFAEASPARRLIEALLAPDIRLLTVEGDNRQTSLRLSHEALIEHWPRAQAQIQADRRDIETRSRLESLLRAYEATPMGREKGRALLTGLSLEEGRDLAARWRLSGNEPLGRFIAASARADRLRRNALLTTAAALVAIFAGLAGLAALQWREAEQQRSVALTNEHRAEVSSRLAEEGRAEALRRRVEADAARVRAEEARAGAEAARGAAEQERRAAEAANARAAASQREQSRILAASAQTELDKGNVAIGRTTALRALSEEGTLSAQPIAEGRLALMRAMHLDRFIDRVRLPAGSPVSFAFAQDGSRLVVGNGGREALVYDLDNRKLVHRLPTFNDVATSVDVAPNGRSVLVAGDRRPRVYDLATGALQWQAPPSPTGKSFSWSGRFGPNGRTAIIGWSDNHAQAFEIASGKVVWDFEGAKFTDAPPTGKGTGLDPLMAAVQKAQWRTFGSVQYLSSSSDGRLLAVTSQGDPLRAATVLEAETGRRIATFNVSNENNLIGVDDAVFSPDNQLLAASRQENLAVFDISSGSQLWQFTQPGILNALAFDPGGRHLATGWSDTSVRVWDPRTGAFVTEILGDRAAITSLTFSRDGSRLAIGYASGAVALVETAGWTGSALIRAHGSEVKTLAFTPDGAQLVTGGRDGTIGFWSAWSKFTQPFEAPRWHNLLSLTGERLFASTADGSVLGIWSTTDGKQLNSIALGGIAKSLLRTVDGHFVVAVHKHALNGRALTVLDETGRRIGFVQLPADVDVKQVAVDAPQGLAAVSDGDDSWVFGLRSKSMPRKFAGSLPVFTGSGRLTLLVTPSEGNPQTAGILPARARDGRPRLVTMRLSDGGIFSTFPASCLRYQLGQNVGLVENAEGVVVGDLETGRIKAKLEGRLPRMLGDGRTVLTVSGGSLLVQDATKAVQPTRRTLPKHLGEVLHLEASNDGSRALVFGTTGNALIDPNSGAVIAAWGETSLDKVHVRPDLPDCQPDGKVFRPSWLVANGVLLSRDGRRVFDTTGADGLQIRNGADGRLVSSLDASVHPELVVGGLTSGAILVSEDSASITASSLLNRVVSLDTGRVLSGSRRTDMDGDKIPSPDALTLNEDQASLESDNTILKWDRDGRLVGLNENRPTRFLAPDVKIEASDLSISSLDEWVASPDGNWVVTDLRTLTGEDIPYGEARQPVLVNTQTRLPLTRLAADLGAPETGGRFSRDGSLFVATLDKPNESGYRATVGLAAWDGRTGALIGQIENDKAGISHLTVSRTGRYLALLRDGKLVLYDRAQAFAKRPLPDLPAVTALAFSEDEHRLLLGFQNGSTRVIDLDHAASPVLDFPGLRGPITALVENHTMGEILTLDGSGLVTGFDARLRAVAWEAPTGLRGAGLRAEKDKVYVFSRRGEILRITPDRRFADSEKLPSLYAEALQRGGEIPVESGRGQSIIQPITPPAK